MTFRARVAVATVVVTATLAAGVVLAARLAESAHVPVPPAADATAPGDAPEQADAPATDVHLAAQPDLASNRCAANRYRRVVLVSIAEQHAWFCARHRTVLGTAITSGATSRPGDATPRGTFRIQGLNRDTALDPGDGRYYPVKYWIPFDAPLYGFHDAQWQTIPYGSSRYTTEGSHGCIHLPLRAIRYLYQWAQIGTHVVIG